MPRSPASTPPRSPEPCPAAPPRRTSFVVFTTRGLRAIGDGLLSATLASLLLERGFSERSVGVLSTATLLGSAAALVAITRFAPRATPVRVLTAMSVLMIITGVAFAASESLALLVLVALIGPLNPSSGDVSAFLPAEQTILGSAVPASERTAVLARFSLVALTGASLGAFAAPTVQRLGRSAGLTDTDGLATAPLVYAGIGAVVLVLYRSGLRNATEVAVRNPSRLGPSRKVVRELTCVFALDSAGGGLVVYSLIALWLQRRFGFELDAIGAVLGAMSLASGASSLLSARLSARIGLVETMVLTHLPANLLLLAAAFAPTASWAVGLLIARSLLSQMDVPARVSLVSEPERSAASAATNLPRALATASTPLLGAWMLERSTTGWPLVAGAGLKIVYDVVLWIRFRPAGRALRAAPPLKSTDPLDRNGRRL
jgi:MFS family permease